MGTRSTDDSGLGLIGIRERVALVGGTVTIASASGQGTRIAITIPLRWREESGEDHPDAAAAIEPRMAPDALLEGGR